MKRFAVALVFGALLVTLGTACGADVPTIPDTPPAEAPLEGGRWFFCALGQTVKIAGLISANPGLVLAGAIGGGIACGMGW